MIEQTRRVGWGASPERGDADPGGIALAFLHEKYLSPRSLRR